MDTMFNNVDFGPLKKYLDDGLVFPTARSKALYNYINTTNLIDITEDKLQNILNSSNNILGFISNALHIFCNVSNENCLVQPLFVSIFLNNQHLYYFAYLI